MRHQIDVDHAPDLVLGTVHQRRAGHDTRVVDEHVHLAPFGLDRGRQLVDRFHVGHVGRVVLAHGVRAGPATVDHVSRLFDAIRVDVYAHQSRAFFGQLQAQLPTQSAARAGHLQPNGVLSKNI